MNEPDLWRRYMSLDEHEAFWIDCIRVACKGNLPKPTLARAQALRRLFAPQRPLKAQEEAVHDQT